MKHLSFFPQMKFFSIQNLRKIGVQAGFNNFSVTCSKKGDRSAHISSVQLQD